MNATDGKVDLLKLHPCAHGLTDEALREIVESAGLLCCRPGDCIHRANDPVTSVYLIIHGRLLTKVIDTQGNIILKRFQSAGEQFGGLSAALAEPVPMECSVEGPLLRFDYTRGPRVNEEARSLPRQLHPRHGRIGQTHGVQRSTSFQQIQWPWYTTEDCPGASSDTSGFSDSGDPLAT